MTFSNAASPLAHVRGPPEGLWGPFSGARILSRMMRAQPATEAADAHEVVGSKTQQRLVRHLGPADELGFGQSPHRLNPGKGLFDALTHLEALAISGVASHAPVHHRVSVLGRHVGCDLEAPEPHDEGFSDINLARPKRDALFWLVAPSEHGKGRFALSRAAGLGNLDVHNEPVAVFHEDDEDVPHVAKTRLPLGRDLDPLKKAAHQAFVEEALAVGTEGGVIPREILDVQTHKPAAETLDVNRLDQLEFATDGKQDLQQCLEQNFRQHRGAAAAGIDGFEFLVHARQQRIDQGEKLTQSMFRWNPLFQAHVTEHRPLKVLAASHAHRLRCRRCGSDDTGDRGGVRGFFQRPA